MNKHTISTPMIIAIIILAALGGKFILKTVLAILGITLKVALSTITIIPAIIFLILSILVLKAGLTITKTGNPIPGIFIIMLTIPFFTMGIGGISMILSISPIIEVLIVAFIVWKIVSKYTGNNKNKTYTYTKKTYNKKPKFETNEQDPFSYKEEKFTDYVDVEYEDFEENTPKKKDNLNYSYSKEKNFNTHNKKHASCTMEKNFMGNRVLNIHKQDLEDGINKKTINLTMGNVVIDKEVSDGITTRTLKKSNYPTNKSSKILYLNCKVSIGDIIVKHI